jgi:hypothetical protein
MYCQTISNIIHKKCFWEQSYLGTLGVKPCLTVPFIDGNLLSERRSSGDGRKIRPALTAEKLVSFPDTLTTTDLDTFS